MEGTSPGAPSLPGNPVGGVDLHQEDANISSALPSDIGAQEPADSEGHTPTGANTGAQGHLRSRKRTKLVRALIGLNLKHFPDPRPLQFGSGPRTRFMSIYYLFCRAATSAILLWKRCSSTCTFLLMSPVRSLD